jgi:hypothetical protein
MRVVGFIIGAALRERERERERGDLDAVEERRALIEAC